MKPKLFLNDVYIKKSSIHGYGVFAQSDIQKGEIVEECIGLKVNCKELCFTDYIFKVDSAIIMLTGFGSLYNHCTSPNASYDFDGNIMTFVADRLIRAGEEIFISYGDDWFSVRNLSIKKPAFWRNLFNSLTFKLMRATIVCIALVGFFYLMKNYLKYLL